MKTLLVTVALGLCSCAYKPTAEDIARAIEATGYVTQRVIESSSK